MEELLEMIRRGESAALPELAGRFDMSEELLLARLERYEQLGYVKRVLFDGGGCGKNCKKCRGCSGGSKSEPFVYWEKGEKLK